MVWWAPAETVAHDVHAAARLTSQLSKGSTTSGTVMFATTNCKQPREPLAESNPLAKDEPLIQGRTQLNDTPREAAWGIQPVSSQSRAMPPGVGEYGEPGQKRGVFSFKVNLSTLRNPHCAAYDDFKPWRRWLRGWRLDISHLTEDQTKHIYKAPSSVKPWTAAVAEVGGAQGQDQERGALRCVRPHRQ
jgi:hypothetical protein